MGMSKAVNMLAELAKQGIKINDGDYIGDDGLLYCGKCHTRKQVRINLPDGTEVTPHCLCKCEAEKAEKEKKDLEDRERLLTIERYRSVGFTDKELKKCRFSADDGINKYVTDIAKNYVDNFSEFKKAGKGLIFYGGVGTGKTFLASCIANELIDKCIPCCVTNFSRIVNKLTGMFEGKQEYIDSLNNFSLLVIDDFAMERSTEYVNEIVYNVIDSRYRSGKPLIVTTNLSKKDLDNPPDIDKQRIYSRIKEMCFPVEVKGTDRRSRNNDGDIMLKLFEKRGGEE
ncbi:MAG: ATP-binding protein [Bacillota bacterium]|jgi:DNA replication protein DnaC